MELACGGPPPLTERPPIVNLDSTIDITPEILIEMNRRITGNSAPKSVFDIDYHRIMPIFAPFGKRLKVKRKIAYNQIIYSTCPFARRHYDGSYKLLTDDVLERDSLTGKFVLFKKEKKPNKTEKKGKPTWKIYTNPNNDIQTTYEWDSIITYDDFPYRCNNGQCVKDRSYCELSEKQFPVCNNKGKFIFLFSLSLF